MISHAPGVRINFFSMLYLVMLIERRQDYHFATQARTLALLSPCCPASGSRNPGYGMSDLTCMTLKEVSMQWKPSRVSINKVASRRNGQQSVWLALGRMALALLAAGALTVAGAPESDESNGNEQWVGTWSNALHEPDLGVPGLSNPGFNNQTLRQIVHISVGGPRVRVRLSTFGASSLVIGAAHIALRATA